jgi:hypothetical protein
LVAAHGRFFSYMSRMSDFKSAFSETFGKSIAWGLGFIVFVLMLALLGGTGLLGWWSAGLPPFGK